MKTRYAILVAVCAVLLFTVGCVVTSVYPFYTGKDLIFDSSLLGDWVDGTTTNAPDEFARVERLGDKGYLVTAFESNGQTNSSRLYLFRLKNTLFTDECTKQGCEDGLPLHQISKILRLQPFIETASMNYEWLRQLLEKNPRTLRHIIVRENSTDKGRLVLTADTADLQAFLLKHLNDTNAWNAPGQFKPAPKRITSAPPDKSMPSLTDRLAEQTRRIDRLYEALGPELEEMEKRSAEMKIQQSEDAFLTMTEVLRQNDKSYTSKLLFIPKSSLLAVAQRGGQVKLLCPTNAANEQLLTGLDEAALCLATDAEGTKVFAGTETGAVYSWNRNDNTNAEKVFDWKGWPVTALAVSPDASLAVCACNGKYGSNRVWTTPDQSLVAFDVATGKQLWEGKAGRADFQALSFSGDGKSLAVVHNSDVLLLDPRTGRTLKSLSHDDYPTGPLSTALSRDGRLCAIGYAPYHLGIWDTQAEKCLRLVAGHKNWVVSLSFSPDGSLLASSSGDSTASVWDVDTGKEIGRTRFGDGPTYIYSVSMADNGRWVAAARAGELAVFELPKGR